MQTLCISGEGGFSRFRGRVNWIFFFLFWWGGEYSTQSCPKNNMYKILTCGVGVGMCDCVFVNV